MDAAALPGRSGQVRHYRLNKARMGVASNQSHPESPLPARSAKSLFHPAWGFMRSLFSPPIASCRPSALGPVAIITTTLTIGLPSSTFMGNTSVAARWRGGDQTCEHGHQDPPPSSTLGISARNEPPEFFPFLHPPGRHSNHITVDNKRDRADLDLLRRDSNHLGELAPRCSLGA